MQSRYLPAELLDNIVDLLHDTRNALESCCLVSKSWVPRTRKHLFAHVALDSLAKLQSWKTTFQDPSTSPARYTRTLFIKFPRTITPADAEEGGWIPTFSRVVSLAMNIHGMGAYESLVLFHGFSPVIRSLRITSTSVASLHTLGFICSFPLLEDISMVAWFVETNQETTDEQPTSFQHSKPPALTGSLELSFVMGMNLIASGLLSLRSGLHFRRLNLAWSSDEDISLTEALVERCRYTLEYLRIGFGPIGKSFQQSRACIDGLPPPAAKPLPRSIDLSKATKLREVAFPCESSPQWVTKTLQTVSRDHRKLQQISLDATHALRAVNSDRFIPADPTRAIGEAAYQEWLELDRSIARLWESHSIRLKAEHDAATFGNEMEVKDEARKCLECLLPEVTDRGIVDLVKRKSQW